MKTGDDLHGPSRIAIGSPLSRSVPNGLPFIMLVFLAVSLPFESTVPLWTIGPLSTTNLELVLYLTLALALMPLLRSRRAWMWPSRYWLWLLPFVAGLLLSSLLAPQLRTHALKASLRLIAGMLLALAALQILRWPSAGRTVSIALLSGGLIAALIGWYEITWSQLAWMGLFRAHITRVGPVLRLTGTFDYANQAAMYMEATLPFLVAAAWYVSLRRVPDHLKVPLLAALFLLTLFYLHSIVLTLSRAGSATVVAIGLVLGGWIAIRRSNPGRRIALWWLGLAAVMTVVVSTNVVLSDSLRLRMKGGNVDVWYRARIAAPPTLVLSSGATSEVPIVVTNEGSLVWRSQGQNPISLGARLLNEEGTHAYSELRWPFPGSVNPQETVQMLAPFTAPLLPGVYELRWDVVQEDIAWFGTKSGLYATTHVTVLPGEGQANQPGAETFVMVERAAWDYVGPVPSRVTLWSLALRMMRDRPLLGIGMDNFRLTYGEQLGNPAYDNTVHTNNLYLEMMVSVGLIGSFPFIMWSGSLLLDVLRTLRRPDLTMWQTALAAGLLTFFVHGLFDFFLLFNSTGWLFWLLAALWAYERRDYAHRI